MGGGGYFCDNRGTTILVILCILASLELSHCCHRRVEYHHYYKKQPHKGYGGHGGGHGGHGGGHGGGYGHGHGGHGHSEGHGQKYEKGHGHGGGGYDMGGYGHGQGHGHGGGGYGHGHKGHGGGGYQKAAGHGVHGGGYIGGGGHGDGYGHDEHGHHGGMHHGSYGHKGGHSPGYGGGHNTRHKGKGQKYRWQMYESAHYDDKDGHGHHQGYSHASPHYMQKGYGYSGPYPNTEYSNPVEAAVNPPNHGGGTNANSFYAGAPQLDAADTADLIRNNFDSKENEIMAQQPYGSASNTGSGLIMSDSSGGSEQAVDMLPTPTMELSSSGNTGNPPESKVDASTGNFDMNLNFNSDLPDPFKKSFISGSGLAGQRKRKRISSKYRSGLGNAPSLSDAMISPSEQGQGLYRNGDQAKGDKPPDFVEFMNF